MPTIPLLMKKILLTLFALSYIHICYTQTRIALKGGYNHSTAKVSYNAIVQPVTAVPGAGFGLLFKVPFDGPLHFSPYAQINTRGFSVKPNTGNYTKIQTMIAYLDIVPALSLDFGNKDHSFVFSVGPVLSFTDFGREKKTDSNQVTSSAKMKFGFGEYSWIDLGAASSIGVHFKKTFIEAVYYYGLANINNNSEFDGINIRNRMLTLGFGYYLK